MIKNKNSKFQLKQEDVLEDRENEEEGKEKKRKRSESVEKRKRAREKDRAARWSGLIMLIMLMMIGFLLWVSGKIRKEKQINNNLQYQYITPGFSNELK